MAVAHVTLPGEVIFDGVDLLPYIKKTDTAKPHEALYWRNGFSKAIRKGNFKLYINEKDKAVLLYDLFADPNEYNDLHQLQPGKVSELHADLQQWEEQLPKPLWESRFHYKLKVRDKHFMFPT